MNRCAAPTRTWSHEDLASHHRARRSAGAAGVLSGCAQFDLADRFSFSDRPAKPPSRLTAMWTHTVLNQPGKPGVRGFGGRVMFYGKDRDKSVSVDGSLTIYAYDDTNSDGAHRRR